MASESAKDSSDEHSHLKFQKRSPTAPNLESTVKCCSNWLNVIFQVFDVPGEEKNDPVWIPMSKALFVYAIYAI